MPSAIASATAILLGLVLAIAIVDVRSLRIPNWLNAAVLLAGLMTAFVTGYQPFSWVVFSAIAAFAIMWAVAATFRRLRGQTGLGFGDVKFTAAAAAWIGLQGLPVMILVASLTALVFIGSRITLGASWQAQDKLPFGPFLGFGLLVSWLLGLPTL